MNYLQRLIASRDNGYAVADAIRLNDAFMDLASRFAATSITDSDRSTDLYANIYAQFERAEEYLQADDNHSLTERVTRNYLNRCAADAVHSHIKSGRLQVWTSDAKNHDGRQRDPSVLFGNSNIYLWVETLERGVYVPKIPFDIEDQIPDYVYSRLWVKNRNWEASWPLLLEERLIRFGSHVRPELERVVRGISSGTEPLAKRWTADRMRDEILNCGHTNCSKAWNNYFKPKKHVHQWKHTNFFDFWSTARGTKGMPGRPSQ